MSTNILSFGHQKAKAVFAQLATETKPYHVQIRIGSDLRELDVLAFTTCDAITQAIDIYFDGDETMPTEGLEIMAYPFDAYPRAA